MPKKRVGYWQLGLILGNVKAFSCQEPTQNLLFDKGNSEKFAKS